MAGNHDHGIPLKWLFLALLALTALEVIFYEVWAHTAQQGDPFVPKLTMVLVMLFVLTLPKAAIVMIYFMHLKFEKHLIVGLALLPLITVGIAILPTLTDIVTLKNSNLTLNQAGHIGEYSAEHGAGADQPTHEAAPVDDGTGY